MYKLLLLSHGRLCEGMKDTLRVFARDFEFVTAIPFFVDGIDADGLLAAYAADVSEGDTVVVCTDVMNGSVDQRAVAAFAGRDNVFVVSGFNLALVATLALTGGPGIDGAAIDAMVVEARDGMARRSGRVSEALAGDE